MQVREDDHQIPRRRHNGRGSTVGSTEAETDGRQAKEGSGSGHEREVGKEVSAGGAAVGEELGQEVTGVRDRLIIQSASLSFCHRQLGTG